MEVILLQRVEKLGQMGDIVKVKPGFARNYLLPQKKAVRATDENRKRFEDQRSQLEATNLQYRAEAEAVAARVQDLTVVLIRQAGESGQLYGSVNARDVAKAVSERGITVNRQQVRLTQPIKTLGLHKVDVALHPEVILQVTVSVARSLDEAANLQRGGRIETAQEGATVSLEDQAEQMFEAEAAEHVIEDLSAENIGPDTDRRR
jgi:large subunit ribosomal protein L9